MKGRIFALLSLTVLLFAHLSVSSKSHNTIYSNDAPRLEKINQSYYIDGQEALEVDTIINNDSSNYSKSIIESNEQEWNIATKNYTNNTLQFINFDQNHYSYRQFAFDSNNASNSKKSISKNVHSNNQTKIINTDESSSVTSDNIVGTEKCNYSMKSIIGSDDRQLISNPNSWPYKAAGQLVIKYVVQNNVTGNQDNMYFIGTGFLEGPDLLVTAGHCLYGDVTNSGDYEDHINNPRFADEIYYYPARNGNVDPYGGVKIERSYIEKEYYLNQQKDWGCCKLSNPIGNQTGWFGKISNFYEKDYEITTFGYPGSKNGFMYSSTGIMTKFEDNGWYYRTNLDTEGGQSGSPYRVTINGNTYVCGIHTYSVGNSYTGGIRIDSFMFAFFNSFVTGDKVYQIKPTDYNYADAYPVDSYTENTFVSHSLDNGLDFRTRRYRTGYIHNEYIVMSSIRKGIPKNEAMIEYSFNSPVTRIEVDLAYWRSVSNEWLSSSNGSAVLQIKNGEGWSNKFDLLSKETALPTNRSNPTTYTIDFDHPVYVFRFFCHYNGTSTLDSNRGRICIGNMNVWMQSENYMPLNGSELEYKPSEWNNNSMSNYNCYAYALNTKLHGFMQPGASDSSYNPYDSNYLTGSKLYEYVLLDGQNYNFSFKPIGKYDACDIGYYKVALVIAPNRDYHWYRQNYDGTWSHKPGGTAVTNLERKGNLIYDPESCDRTTGFPSYSEFVGFYQVNVSNMI